MSVSAGFLTAAISRAHQSHETSRVSWLHKPAVRNHYASQPRHIVSKQKAVRSTSVVLRTASEYEFVIDVLAVGLPGRADTKLVMVSSLGDGEA